MCKTNNKEENKTKQKTQLRISIWVFIIQKNSLLTTIKQFQKLLQLAKRKNKQIESFPVDRRIQKS